MSWDNALDYENIVVYNITVSVTDNGVAGDRRLLTAFGHVIVTVDNVNDVTVSSFNGTTTLPTAGGGVTLIYGANLGRIAPLPGGSWGHPAWVTFLCVACSLYLRPCQLLSLNPLSCSSKEKQRHSLLCIHPLSRVLYTLEI